MYAGVGGALHGGTYAGLGGALRAPLGPVAATLVPRFALLPAPTPRMRRAARVLFRGRRLGAGRHVGAGALRGATGANGFELRTVRSNSTGDRIRRVAATSAPASGN